MSFFTSLTGLNAATTQLSVTSNNIANAGTTGFKRSRSDFGDIFATSPLQKASTVVGQGTALKQVTQEFSQGNIELSGNSLDLAVTGEGFFPLRSADGQDLFTRNGSFLLDEQNTVVNSAGQFLKVASVDSLGKADFKADLIPLTIAPRTVGEAIATSNIDFAINFPAESLPLTTIDENNLEQIKEFNPDDPSTYAKSAAITIFDENGNDFLLTFYYRRVGVASSDDPFNKWQTHVVLDGQEITPALGQATSSSGVPLFVDKYGNIVPEDELPVVLNDNLVFQKYNLDDLSEPSVSVPATARGGLVERPYLSDETGVNFAPVPASTTLTINPDELANIGTTTLALSGAAAANAFTVTAHGLSNGDRVTYQAGTDDVATGLIDGAEYYVTNVTANTFELAATLDDATADTPIALTIAGGTANQTFAYQEEVKLSLADGDGNELAMIQTTQPARASLDVINTGDIESNDRISIKLTDADNAVQTITTSALEADATVEDVIAALNRAASAKSVAFSAIEDTVIPEAASAALMVNNSENIALNDRISLDFTDENGATHTVTTAALAAASSVADIAAELNRVTSIVPAAASSIQSIAATKSLQIKSADDITASERIAITLTDEEGNVETIDVGPGDPDAAAPTPAAIISELETLATETGYTITGSAGDDGASNTTIDLTITRADGTNFSVAIPDDHSLTTASLFDTDTDTVVDTTGTSVTANGLESGVIASTAHGFKTGDRIFYQADGAGAITGLTSGQEYFIVHGDNDSFALAPSFSDAISATNLIEDLVADPSLDGVSFTPVAQAAPYEFAANGDELQISRADGVNFQIASDLDRYSLSGGGFTDPSTQVDITEGETALTDNGITLAESTLSIDVINAVSHGFETGDRIVYQSHGQTAIGGLVDGQEYFVRKVDGDSFQLADSYEDAVASSPTLLSGLTATTGNTLHTFKTAEGLGQYRFSNDTDINGDVAISSRIQITRADGKNFKIAADATGYSLSGNAAIHENISEDSPEISSTATALTLTGSTLDSTTTADELAAALKACACRTDFDVELSSTVANTLTISNATGEDFTITTTRLPNGTTGLLSGLQTEVSAALTETAGSNTTDATANGVAAPDLSAAFDLTIDEDPNDVNATSAVTIDLSALNDPLNSELSGDEVALLMTQEINRQFGDQRYFNLSSDANRQFRMTFDTNTGDSVSPQVVDIYLPASSTYTANSLSDEIERQLRSATGTQIEVAYSRSSKGFVFTPESDTTELTITNVPASASLTGSAVPNTLFGLNTLSSDFTLDSRGRYSAEVIPNGDEVITEDSDQQRYGISVEFLPNTEEGGTGGTFAISSGSTGDGSAIRIEKVSDAAKAYFGFDSDDPAAVLEVVAESGSTAVRGVESTAARVFGKPVSIDPDETFFVDDLTNSFTVTVDSVTESFRLPVGNYNLNSFTTTLQNRINSMEDSRGNSISGVQVNFDQVNEIFTFTSGTTGDSSFFQISGSSRYGLEDIESDVGKTSTYRPPVAENTLNDRPIYVTKDENGVFREFSTDTTSGFTPLPGSREFTADPGFRPLFLDKGELTFDTAGNLISPLGGISLDNVVIGGSGNTLNIDIDYDGSTQFSGDFSVNGQSQNGQPNGSLVAVDIADDGLVTASYSNGTQDLKGKIVLSTFSTPNGLRQLGDSTFLESNESGVPALGEPGGAGFGTIRAGARERANVDLTSELVDLITAQRNFQANAKAIETSSTLTSTIINIRS